LPETALQGARGPMAVRHTLGIAAARELVRIDALGSQGCLCVERQMEGDPSNPARKRTSTSECVELHERLETGLLRDLLRQRRISQDCERHAVRAFERRLPVEAAVIGHAAILSHEIRREWGLKEIRPSAV